MRIIAEQWVVAALLLCLGGAVLTWLLGAQRRAAGWAALAVTALSAGLVFTAVGQVLIRGAGPPATFWALPSLGFALRLHVDGLSSVFLILAAGIAVPAAFYSIRYMDHYPEESLRRYYPNLLVFLAAMYGLVTTTDMMWFFFIFWQMMTLPGYALIRFERRVAANRRAALRFLIMMQIACAATMVGAEMLVWGGATVAGTGLKYDFDSISHTLPGLLTARPGWAAVAFLLFLVGFGIKMGMWPFGQFWLPDAHPAAPSPVSAMLSGVMIKTGVYGLIRYFLWLVPAEARADFPLEPWGAGIAVLGTLTLFTGTMQALRQEQSKRLLAFHSIGQVGYILLAAGTCLILLAAPGSSHAPLAVVGLLAALFHTLNHGVFKSLLFLNAGSMLYATGTQDLNRLGGLMRCLPLTALTALVAAFSISGVPLFNGFASKWMIYVTTIQGAAVAGFLAVCGLVAILTSALTLASFIKFFGVSFLGRTSPLVASRAGAAGRVRLGYLLEGPQGFLALVCLLGGLLPFLPVRLLQTALGESRQGLGILLADAMPAALDAGMALEVPGGAARFVPLAVAGVLALLFLLARFISRLGASARRPAEPWLCGYAREGDALRYTAHHLYGDLKRYFRWLGGKPRPPTGGGAAASRPPLSRPDVNP